jgi:hypothetical protein
VSGLRCYVVTYDSDNCKWIFFCTASFGIYEEVKTTSSCQLCEDLNKSGGFKWIFVFACFLSKMLKNRGYARILLSCGNI